MNKLIGRLLDEGFEVKESTSGKTGLYSVATHVAIKGEISVYFKEVFPGGNFDASVYVDEHLVASNHDLTVSEIMFYAINAQELGEKQ
jgi:hypothetical protein